MVPRPHRRGGPRRKAPAHFTMLALVIVFFGCVGTTRWFPVFFLKLSYIEFMYIHGKYILTAYFLNKYAYRRYDYRALMSDQYLPPFVCVTS